MKFTLIPGYQVPQTRVDHFQGGQRPRQRGRHSRQPGRRLSGPCHARNSPDALSQSSQHCQGAQRCCRSVQTNLRLREGTPAFMENF
jgi:hypothetical protein